MRENKINVGIIGAGSRGINCFGKTIATRDDVQIVALCDPNQVRMELAARELGIKLNFYTSVEAMVVAEKLDAVITKVNPQLRWGTRKV